MLLKHNKNNRLFPIDLNVVVEGGREGIWAPGRNLEASCPPELGLLELPVIDDLFIKD